MRVLFYRYMFGPFLLGLPQACSILALVTELLWIHIVYMISF
jgi:hypothetical protein